MKADGTDLTTYASFVRLLSEGGSGKRGGNYQIPSRHGEYTDAANKWFGPADFMLEIGVKTDDGYGNLSNIQKLLGKPTGLVTLQRVTGNAGTVEALVELLGDPQPSQNRFVYVFPMRAPEGSWFDASASTATGTAPSVTTSGDRPIGDMIVTFSGVGSATHTDVNGVTSTLTIDAAAGAGTYVVDCGDRTVTKAGVNQDRYFTVSQPWWWRFSPGTAQTIDSSVSITVSWRNRWAAG